MIITILVILLYALLAVLLLELVFWIIGMFIQIPPRVRSIIYAIVGVLFIIWIVQAVIAGGGLSLPPISRH